MQDTEINYTFAAFESLVNSNLEARHQYPSTSDELEIVQMWHKKASEDQRAHLKCVDEIIAKRDNE